MPDTLFYDGKCSMCSKEINLLRRLKGSALELVDIHGRSSVRGDEIPSKSEMLAMLHLRRDSGDWLTGLDATVAAWRHTHLGWMLVPLRWPLIRNVVDAIYLKWAERRFCKLNY